MQQQIKTLIIDSNYRVDSDSQSHDFKVRFRNQIQITKGIQLAYVYIPFTQFPIRQQIIYDQQGEILNGIQSMSFVVQRKNQDQQVIVLFNIMNTYCSPDQLAQEITLQLGSTDKYNELKCMYDKYSQRLKFEYPNDYEDITFENVNKLSDIHNILGFGNKQGVKYGLRYDSKVGLSYFQNQLNLQSIPYLNIYIQELDIHDNIIFPMSNQPIISTFTIPILCNRKEVIQLYEDYDTTQFLPVKAIFSELSIKLLQGDNIPFDINDSRMVLIIKYI